MTTRNISLLGATYSAVPAVTLPVSGGGTATFTEVTDTTATASDVASGKYFYTSAGVRTQGTNSGGGGGTIVSKTITTNGTYNASDDNADGYSPVTVNIPSSSWTLIKYDTLTVNTTSTTAAEAGTIACGSSAWTANDVIWVHIRGQSGKRAGYFYGTDAMFVNYRAKNSSTSACSTPAIQVIRVGSNGSYTVATGQYGVFAYSIASNGTITINKRYQSTNTLTINDTFDIYVYKLALPSGLTLFD